MIPIELINMGDCHYCNKPVQVPEGTNVDFLHETLVSKIDGHVIKDTRHPTHIGCKEDNKSDE